MELQIQAYRAQDREKLTAIWLDAVRATHDFLEEADIDFYHRIVREEALSSVEVWVARVENGDPVGFIGLGGSKVEMLFVHPDRHGKGIGRRLLDHAQELKGPELQVDVNEQNDGARSFYRKYGFQETGRSELDGSGRPFPLIHMSRAEYRRGTGI